MGTELSIARVLELKKELEQKIALAIQEFEQNTSLPVISVHSHDAPGTGGVIWKVTVKL